MSKDIIIYREFAEAKIDKFLLGCQTYRKVEASFLERAPKYKSQTELE